MKKTLKELELNIPTINILESRKITGGYDGERGGDFDDDNWQGSPGEMENPFEIPDVVVTPGEMPDPGFDPREEDPQEQEDPDNDRNEDGRDDGKGGDGPSKDDGKNDPTVQVPDGWCILGSIAAAIQAATGCSAADAIKAADGAFDKCGMNPDPTPGNPGIPTPSGQEMADLLGAAGFEVTFGADDSTTTPQNISDHFDNGGAGLGYIDNEGAGHMVYLEDYDLGTNTYDYYDPVLGTDGSIGGNDCQIILFK